MTATKTPRDVAYAEVATPKDAVAATDDVREIDKDDDRRLLLGLRCHDGHTGNDSDTHAMSATAIVTTASTTAPSPPRDEPPRDTAPIVVTLRDLYRYASHGDRALLLIGLLMVTLNGALFPCMAILLGEALGAFAFVPVDMVRIERVSAAFAAVAVALFVTDYVAHVCLETTAQKQMHALRIHVFRHVVYKEVAWFERCGPSATDTTATTATATTNGPQGAVAELQATTRRIKDGMGVKLGEVLRCATQFATGYAIGFATHWQLSIVMASVMPFMAISLSYIIKTLRARAIFSQQKYAEAGAIATETLRAIRTVRAFNGEQRAIDAYVAKATSAEHENLKLVRVLSVVLGIFFGMVWVTYGIGLWFGASLVASESETDPRTVFTAFYGILIGTISLAQISPNIAAVVTAKAIAGSLFAILNEPSTINAEPASSDAVAAAGIVPLACHGRIEIVHVDFAYPSRPDTLVLRDYSLTITAGETVAFVGPSGGGKSTLLTLLQRFYDPDAGEIRLDGYPLRNLQLPWLRRQIGVVAQEPVLFAATIFDNIAAALPEWGDDATGGDVDGVVSQPEKLERRKERIESAARLANAHEFIMALPLGYDTFVGEKGVTLSGGQKQRIAIARALVRNPRILLLDEATSALDTDSEAQIQHALDSIISGTTTSRTTLIVAHRLSTIKRATRICVVADGEIVESGTHEELLRMENGKFQDLVTKSDSRFDGTLVPRNASLLWCDSLTDVLYGYGDRDSSVPMLAARSIVDTDTAGFPDSKRSDFVATAIPDDDDDDDATSQSHANAVVEGADGQTLKQDDSVADWSTVRLLVRLLRHTRNERCLFVVGLLAAALNGASFPVSAILLSEIVSSMVNNYAAFRVSQQQRDLDRLYDDVWQLSLAYLVGAVVVVAITFAQSFAFRYQAEKLVTRLRDRYFSAMCHQPIAFFDDPTHGSGALASDLATKPTRAVLLAGDTPGRVVQALTTFIGALLVSFCMGSWLLSLVMCVLFPLLILSDFVRTNTLKGTSTSRRRTATPGSATETSETYVARANVLAAEAVHHIRTVASFGMEQRLVDEYRQLSLVPMHENARVAHANGVALGFSSFITLAVYAFVFWFGGTLVRDHQISFAQLVRSLMAIMISATGIGQATAHLAEVDEATAAARSVFAMEDTADGQRLETAQAMVPTGPAVGSIVFQNVTFAYPSRPTITVMRAFSLTIAPGQLVAFCGPSGGGKSTVIALLERFYTPNQGTITLDGVRLDALDVRWLRAQIGLIAQEPVLFAGSIHDNIAYGAADASAVTRADVEHAAAVANAHAFVSAFPDGYDTLVGGSGDQLSGGQKQRIAIARAVLKDPAMLILDEATSALDADSEQLVQDALEQVIQLKKRTTLVIAHRMRTIRHADTICVVANGAIVEQGTHSELLRLPNGLYVKLVENATDERFSTVE